MLGWASWVPHPPFPECHICSFCGEELVRKNKSYIQKSSYEDAQRAFEHGVWSVWVPGVVTSRSQLRFRVKSEISKFHISEYCFLFFHEIWCNLFEREICNFMILPDGQRKLKVWTRSTPIFSSNGPTGQIFQICYYNLKIYLELNHLLKRFREKWMYHCIQEPQHGVRIRFKRFRTKWMYIVF